MGLVSRSIPTLINGVSQQPNSLRLPTQAEAQDNFYSSVVEGLTDRPPTKSVAKIYSGAIGDANPHFINRDSTERYVVLLQDGALTVHDLDGVSKTVSTPDGTTYLDCTTPSTQLKAVTISDYTFILNTTIQVALDAAVTASRPREGLVFVKAGNYGSTYQVLIDGVVQADYTTSTSVVTDIATDNIALQLATELNTNIGASYTITRVGSVIHVSKTTGDFRLSVSDSQGGASLLAFKDATQTFTSLPTVAPNGFQLKIDGDENTEYNHYHAKFVVTQTGDTFGPGSWEETIGFSEQYKLAPATMPHILVRNGDGTFTFSEAVWDDLTVGDTEVAPTPSFVGKMISDVFLFKSRLGILAGDREVYSGVGAYFNFWKTTVIDTLDDDPIDYQVSHNKVPSLKNAVAFDEKTVVFSEQTQFLVQGAPLFTARTLQTDPVTEYSSRQTCKPLGLGKNVYFAFPREEEGSATGFDGIREYFVDSTTAVKDAVDITAQVPKYIPAGVFRLLASSTENILIALTAGDQSKMYMYKFFYAGDEKLQSAWSEHTMGVAGTKVLGGEFINSLLYLTIQRPDGVYLERMNFAPGVTDPNSTFVTLYDRRITEEDCTSVIYNGVYTTWTLPYVADGTMKVVTREVNPGQLITVTAPSTSTLRAVGDYTTTRVYIGQPYLRTYTFSKLYLREERNGSSIVITTGRLQIRTMTLLYSRTGAFTITVTPDYRDPSTSVFTGRILGSGANIIGNVALADGEFRFPVLSENHKVTITVTTDSFLPCHLLGAEWEAHYWTRSPRG
jgi:hypothetical protein